MTPHRSRHLALAFCLPLVLTGAGPAHAGFWENLFGVEEKPVTAAPQAVPAPQAKAKSMSRPDGPDATRKRVAAFQALKASQAGKDPAVLAVQDNTLRRGDIVSGPDGLRVYLGGDPETGEAHFAAANDPNLERKMRDSLLGLKRPPQSAPAPETLRASAPETKPSPAKPVSIERDGKTIRVVGGSYQPVP